MGATRKRTRSSSDSMPDPTSLGWASARECTLSAAADDCRRAWRLTRALQVVHCYSDVCRAAFLRKENKVIRLALLIAAVAVSLGIATAATAEGLTPSTLINAGWTCFNDPGAPRIVCSAPVHGR